MKLLIDTQVLVWLAEEDSRLGAATLNKLTDMENTIHVSYFSLFEMTIKASIGKMKYDNSIVNDLPIMGIDLEMPDNNILGRYKVYSPSNKDPFDNILISVAIGGKFTLVTADAKILGVSEPGLSLMDATE